MIVNTNTDNSKKCKFGWGHYFIYYFGVLKCAICGYKPNINLTGKEEVKE